MTGQILHSVANGSPPLQHLRKEEYLMISNNVKPNLLLYLTYYAKACDELVGPSPQQSANATQLLILA